MFQYLPTYQYRIRGEGHTSTHAYLTRGQFNACKTGRFIGYIHVLDHKKIDVLVACTKPGCDTREYWTQLDELEKEDLPECEVCGRPCSPITTK